MATITNNDKYVLNAIFNPNYPLDFDQPDTQDTNDAKNESKVNAIDSTFVSRLFLFFFIDLEIKALESKGDENEFQSGWSLE